MGGSAIDGLIFADFRATNPLVVQISLPFRPVQSVSPVVGTGGRRRNQSLADWACMHSGPSRGLRVFEDESINNVRRAAGLFRIIEYYRSVWLAIKAGAT